jgi:hypothetical protein
MNSFKNMSRFMTLYLIEERKCKSERGAHKNK